MVIREETLLTKLFLSNTFTTWTGNLLVNAESVSSLFTYELVRGGFSTPLELTSDFELRSELTRELTTTLMIESVFSGSLININAINNQIPIFDDPPSPVPAATLPHNVQDGGKRTAATFEFYYPISTLYLSLSAPELGDQDTFERKREKKYSRGNTLITFEAEEWGTSKVFDFAFSELSRSQMLTLLELFRISLGRKIKIKDHLGIDRVGFILTPEAEIFQATRTGFTANFQFQQVD